MKAAFVWIDGNMVPSDQANIPIMTHTLHYGSGAFEGIRCYQTESGPAIFRLSDHINRLFQSFSCFDVVIPWNIQTIEKAIKDTVTINQFQNCYIRPIMFFGSESIAISPKKLSIHCAIIALPFEKYLGREPIDVGISSVRRIHPDSMPVENKINGYYVNSIFAYQDAQKRGFDEALLLDYQSNIAEGSVANIFFVIDGVLTTPKAHSILPGITRSSILSIAEIQGIPIVEKMMPRSDIENATEAFFAGTASEITPIKSIENKQFESKGPITNIIDSIYQNAIHGRDARFSSWLTHV